MELLERHAMFNHQHDLVSGGSGADIATTPGVNVVNPQDWTVADWEHGRSLYRYPPARLMQATVEGCGMEVPPRLTFRIDETLIPASATTAPVARYAASDAISLAHSPSSSAVVRCVVLVADGRLPEQRLT